MAYVETSPIYDTLYKQILSTPEFITLKQALLDDMGEAYVEDITWTPTKRGHPTIGVQVIMRQVCHPNVVQCYTTNYIKHIDDHYSYLDPMRFVFDDVVMELFDTVTKPRGRIYVHGLVKRDSVRNGTSTGKNRLTPYIQNAIDFTKEYREALNTMLTRIKRQAIQKLQVNDGFMAYIKDTAIQEVMKELKTYSHISPDTIQEAVDLHKIAVTMNE
jgi:hypothetical protein